jgi:hypothetical protein
MLLSVSSSTKKDVRYHAPVYGDVSVVETLSGIFTATVATVDTCEHSTGGGEASFYGASFSGKGVIVSEGMAADGGSGSAPYTQKITVFMGVS